MLTEKAQRRYEMMMQYVDDGQNEGVTRGELAELWGITPDMASNMIALFRANGLGVPNIVRAHRTRAGKYGKRNDFVDSANMGDPSLPLCPICLKNDKKGRGFTVKTLPDGTVTRVPKRVHLVEDDGEMYCLECGYDPNYDSYKRTCRMLAHFSRHREK